MTDENHDSVRRMTLEDLDWVVDVTRQRRESLVPHAPRFWNPAQDATPRHRAFLAHLIGDPETLAVRSREAYLIALDRGSTWLVDDAVVTDTGEWAVDGVRLLRHAQDRCGALRLVVPVFESQRMQAGSEVGLVPVEHWWHRDLDPVPTARNDADHDPSVAVEGAVGRLVTAPPVYDPGGPVLMVTDVVSPNALGLIEHEAAARGARVSVVTQHPDDARLAALLTAAGYVLTTAFCERV